MSPRAAVPRAKRILDLVLALLGGLVLLPVILVIALLVRLFLGKPVLFHQPRPGIGGLPFTLYKFRTMRDVSGPDGQPLPDAQRLTAFGRLLRATSMDELPELWNVLRGEMSLVGPRPLLMRYLDRYTPQQFRRHLTPPGITGWAQINGRNNVSWEDKFALDVWYVDNWSLWLDIKILLLTPFKVLSREGINQPGNATAMEFMGTQAKASDEGRPL